MDDLKSTLQPMISETVHNVVAQVVVGQSAPTYDSDATPRPKRTLSHTVAIASPLRTVSVPHPLTRSIDYLAGLRQILRNPKATFKSPQQAEMVRIAMEATQNAIVVLPTGGGKSLAWNFPSQIEGGTGTTVVFTPFVALMADMVRIAKENRVFHSIWRSSDPSEWVPSSVPDDVVRILSAGNPYYVVHPPTELPTRVRLLIIAYDSLKSPSLLL